MSSSGDGSEYRRVLHEWAEKFIPTGGYVRKVDITYDDGYEPTFTDREASLDVSVFWTDEAGGEHWKDIDPEDVGTMGELLTALFSIADVGRI